MEHSDQFLVHTRNRPIRVAFAVDTSGSLSAYAQIESIIEYASKKWGGKFFQIIPAPHGKIADNWIEYLRQYDPDTIYSKVKLDQSTIKKIALNLNPSFVSVDVRPFISLDPDPIDVLPDQKNTAFLWRNPFQEYSILELDLGSSTARTPAYIRKFVKFNFGQLNKDYLTQRLTDGHIVSMPVNSKASLIRGMQPLAEGNRRIYPIEYSYIPGVDRQARRDNIDDGAIRTLFIGDSPEDVIHYWNATLITPDWLSYQMVNAWIPTKMAEDPQLLEAVRGWIEKFHPTGNSNDPHRLNIRSSSVNLTRLRRYARLISTGFYFSTNVQKVTAPAPLSYDSHLAITEDMDTYAVSGNSFNLSVKPVDQMQGGMAGQEWMTDFYVEQDNPDSRNVNPSKYWLLMPPYNSLAHSTLHKIGARVNRLGLPTTFMNRGDRMTSVSIPDNRAVLGNILLGARTFPYHTGDPRDKILDPPFSNYRSSQSGRSMRGFVQLFGGFMEAAHFFENPYWRRIFMTMAGEDPAGDTKINKDLRAVVEKNLAKAVKQGFSQKAVDAWVGRVQTYSRNIKLQGEEKDFSFFEQEFIKEIDSYNRANGKSYKYSESNKKGLKANLSALIDMKMLIIGIRYKCQSCGLKSFYEVDKINSHNKCIGCGAEFTVDSEQAWHYRLNTLAGVNGAIYSQVPLIVALGALYEQSRYSFDPYPPIDIFIGSRQRHLTDLDLFVLMDGKLVIGEVKVAQSQFKDDDLDKLYKAAAQLRPHKVVLSSLDKAPDANNRRRIDDLQAKLKPFGVNVEWLELPPTVFMLYPQGIWGW